MKKSDEKGTVEDKDDSTVMTSNKSKKRTIFYGIVVLIVIAFAASTFLLYVENQKLRIDLEDLSNQVISLQSKMQNQSARMADLEYCLHAYMSLFDSNVKPPITKLEAVAIALSSDGWNSSSLEGMEVSAGLAYVRFFYANTGEMGFQFLHDVNYSVEDWSPRVEYNVTEPGAIPPRKVIAWNRYVWIVTVHESGHERFFLLQDSTSWMQAAAR